MPGHCQELIEQLLAVPWHDDMVIVRRGLWERGSCYRLNAWAFRLGAQKSVAFWGKYIKKKTTISYFVHDMHHEW